MLASVRHEIILSELGQGVSEFEIICSGIVCRGEF